jgi:hypothetical protein
MALDNIRKMKSFNFKKPELFPECDFRNMLDLDCMNTMSDPEPDINLIPRDQDEGEILEDLNIEGEIGTITEEEFLKIKEESRLLDEKITTYTNK